MKARARGLTLLEVTVAVSLLAVVFLGLFQSLLSSQTLGAASSEDVVALQCAQNQIEAMKSTPFASVFSTYYVAGTPPAGPTPGSGGQSFPVVGLGPFATGTIYFLSETQNGAATGNSIQLDLPPTRAGDTTTYGNPAIVPNPNYRYFPIQIAITWRSRANTAATAPHRTFALTSAIFNLPTSTGS